MNRKRFLEKLRARIIRRLRGMERELRQIIIDKEYWNTHRTDAAPFDLGWDRVMLDLVRQQLSAWDRGDIAEVNRIQKKMNDLCDPKIAPGEDTGAPEKEN